jgi:hypothetical protein
MSRLRPRLTYANVVSTLCLFVVLGGSATAARVLITGKNVKDGSLTGADIKKDSIVSSHIKNGSLLGEDFKAGQLPAGPKGDTGPQGPKGDSGSQGAKGDAGSQGVAGTAKAYAFVNANGTIDANFSSGVTQAMVTHGAGQSSYCISGLAFAPKNAVATIASTDNIAFIRNDVPRAGLGSCGTGPNWVAIWINDAASAQVERSFYIQIN